MNSVGEHEPVVQAPLYAPYSEVAHAIQLLDGEPVQRVRDMISAMAAQMGTPQNPVDWSNPDDWIGERLSGDLQTLAKKIWKGSGKELNPRYLNGCYLFINRLHLLDQVNGVYRLDERSRKFLAKDEELYRELDAKEGIPKLLSLVAERSPCKRGDILPAWSDYLKAVSQFSTPATFADTLRRRLIAIAERGLITREGIFYAITDSGLRWLKGFATPLEVVTAATPSPKRTTVSEAAHAHNQEQLTAFRARLMQLEPAQFEHFVKELLDAMDYEDVRVTKVSGDKGVDVIARVQFGITEITEVVQVKRTETTITRPKVDELRGALPYSKRFAAQSSVLAASPKAHRKAHYMLALRPSL